MLYVKIPMERIGVLVGPEGRVRRDLEKMTGVKIRINSREGDVEIDESRAEDPVKAMKARDIVKAIARGFSPERAFRLMDDEVYLEIMDIRDYVGKKKNHVIRMRARVIGSNGKTRRKIEETAHVEISVYGNTVALIGPLLELTVAKNALDMLLSGSEHSTVYRYLERKRSEIKMARYGF